MTIEEKARAYDEALETARKINSGEGVAAPPDWTICEVIFPELKKSEDERIRKALLGLFKIENFNGYTTLNGINVDDVITWLEKQGEQKPAKWSEEDELIALSIEHVMNCASLLNIVPDKIDKIRAWLKSLKQKWAIEESARKRACGFDRGL